MATEPDSESCPASDNSRSIIRARCDLCGTDLDRDWPDLSVIKPLDMQYNLSGKWRRAANLGCSFCNVVISVFDDAAERHACYFLLFQVILGRDSSTGRYLLALGNSQMPVLRKPGWQGDSKSWDQFDTITIHLDEPDVYNLNLEPFIEIPKYADSAPSLDWARNWLTTCRNEHPDCCHSLDREALSSLGDASIRILKICEDTLRLTPLKLRGTLPPYVALSHCWGSSLPLKTLSEDIESIQATGIPLTSLPATFTDAIKMTRSLGFEYIWIDSICIIQDSLADWEEQSGLMATVYGNADLVLAASSASSTKDGCLKKRKSYRETSLQLRSVRDKNRTLDLRYRLLQPKDLAPMVDPLDERAWALQERLVARRYLALGSHDTSWTCVTSSDCECGWWKVRSLSLERPQGMLNVNKLVRETSDEQLVGCWRRNVLRPYAGRELTFHYDNLVAISAIASIFQARLGPKYFAGIWERDLIPGLLWKYSQPDRGHASKDSIPSWSWASLPDLKMIPYTGILGKGPGEEVVEVLEVDTTPSTMNQFGPVSSGFIKLWGGLWKGEVAIDELELAQNKLKVNGYLEYDFDLRPDTSLIMTEVLLSDGTKERSVRRARREEVQDQFYIKTLEEDKIINVFMVPLMKECHRFMGLMLGRFPEDTTKFERLGYFSSLGPTAVYLNEHHEGNLGDSEIHKQEIVII